MRLFKRVVRVEIDSGSERITLGDLRVTFDIRKTRSKTPNQSEIKIYNLSKKTRIAGEASGAEIRVLAGYDDTPLLLTQAGITTVTTIDEPPDSIATFECQDGIVPLRNTRVSLSFARGATVGQVLDEIVEQMGVVLRPTNIDLNKPFRGGYSHVGLVSTVLNDIVSLVGGSWSFQDNDLQILNGTGKSLNTVLFLDKSTGLIGTPEPVEDEVSSEKPVKSSVVGYMVKCLLQPQISPADQIQIESKAVQGVFTVDEVQHIGDTRGNDFYTILKVLIDE